MARDPEIKAVVTAEDRSQASRKRIESGFTNMIANVQSAIMQVGGVISDVGGKLDTATTAMVEDFAQFDQQMQNTISIAQGSAEEFEALRQQALEMSAEMPVGADKIAAGYYQLASAGKAANEILELTPAIMKLATATAAEFEITAKAVTAAIDVFGSQGLEANQATEILMNTVKNFKTTLPELAESMKFSGAIAAQLGISYETLATATGDVRQAGLDASQAGTGIRMMLQSLAAPTSRASELMEDYGITLARTEEGSLDLAMTLQNFNDQLAFTDPIEKAAALSEIFGARASAAADAVMRNAFSLDARAEAATRAGSVEDAYSEQLKGAANQLEISRNAIIRNQEALAEQMVPAQIRANEATAAFYGWLSKLPGPLLEIGGATAVMGGKIMMATGEMIRTIASVSTLITLRGIHTSTIATETTSEIANTAAKIENSVATASLTASTVADTAANTANNAMKLASQSVNKKGTVVTLGYVNAVNALTISETANTAAVQAGAAAKLTDINVKAGGTAASVAYTASIGMETTAETANVIVKRASILATLNLRAAKTKSIIVTKVATAVQWLYNAALYAMPLIAIIAALAAFTVAMAKLAIHLGDNTEGSKDLAAAIKDVKNQMSETTVTIEGLSSELEALQEHYDGIQDSIDGYVLSNMEAKKSIDEIMSSIEGETQQMINLQTEIEGLKSSHEGLESQNRDLTISIQDNNAAIAIHEDNIAAAKDELSLYADELVEANMELTIMSDSMRDNSQDMQRNNIEVMKLQQTMGPLADRRDELQQKQKDGTVLTAAELEELAKLEGEIGGLLSTIESYRDANDVLRISQAELQLAQSEAKEAMGEKEEEYRLAVETATASELEDIATLEEANTGLKDTKEKNTLDMLKMDDDRLDKEKELAEVTPKLTGEQEDAIDDLKSAIEDNNDAIRDAQIEQATWRDELKLTNDELKIQQEHLGTIEERGGELEDFQTFRKKRAKETALKGAATFGIWGVYDYFQAKKDIESYWSPEETPEAETGIDIIRKEQLVKVDPGETILNRKAAEAFRELMANGGGRGSGVNVSNIFNVSHPDADAIISQIKLSISDTVRDAIQLERTRTGV